MYGPLNPVHVFISAFGLGAFSGLAALLRSGHKVNWVSVISAILNSGMMSLGVAGIWYLKFQDNVYFLLGMCVLMGLGGAATIEFAIQAITKTGGLSIGGLTVQLKGGKKDEDDGDKPE